MCRIFVPVSPVPTSFTGMMCCGQTGIQKRIRGGNEVREGELPWLVSVQHQGTHYCTGTIITPIHVLTAGHCYLSNVNSYQIRYGSVDLDKSKLATVAKHFRPTQYVREPEGAPFYDILILLLACAIRFSSQATPICLAAGLQDSVEGKQVQVAGWGAIDDSPTKPRILRATGEIIQSSTSDACKGSSYFGTKYEYCVFNDDKAVCKGDSGGPLMVEEDGIHYQIGLVSYSHLKEDVPHPMCPAKGQPQMFARLDFLWDFLVESLESSGGRQYVKQETQGRRRTQKWRFGTSGAASGPSAFFKF
ncbi:serine protease 33-like isoform X2 [Varroa destructor]|uniref:Peptidase S1 domain-containing protein n=1 Tax=Varroa destructor TaxID=109461 RepID=A0A7M7KSZ2_VARDE|nr:serine protease 33-like isoform X2 [Varroa destructor]